MDPSPSALLAAAVLGFVPGALLHQALRPAASVLERAALAPTLSFAFVFLFGEFAAAAGVPFAPAPFLLLVALTAIAARLRSRSLHRGPDVAPRRLGTERLAIALLVAAVVLSSLSWLLGLSGLAVTPPYTDSVNHGVMAAQVARLETLDPSRVLTSDVLAPPSGATETAFYPMALHGEAALAHRLFGVDFAGGLLAPTLLFAVFVLPVGLFFAARKLVPENPAVAGLSALIGATIGFFPILPMSYGGLPLVIGLAMVPGVAVVAGRYLVGDGDGWEGLTGVVGSVGILGMHTSEIPLLAVILGAAAADAVVSKRSSIAVLVRRGAIFGTAGVLLLVPTIPALIGGTAERSAIDERDPVTVGRAVGELYGTISFHGDVNVVALLAAAGLVLSIRRRRHLFLVATTAVNVVLYFVAASYQGPLSALTVPWYQHPGRIALNFVIVIPFFAAVALVELAPALGRLLGRDGLRGADIRPAVALSCALASLGVLMNTAALRILFEDRALVGADARAAFAYLKEEVRPGERVLNDGNTDGAMWMFPFEGIAPVMGLHPARPEASWEERLWLVENLPNIGSDPRIVELLDKYNVRFMYYDERVFPENPHHIDVAALKRTDFVCERFRRGQVRVFEITEDCA